MVVAQRLWGVGRTRHDIFLSFKMVPFLSTATRRGLLDCFSCTPLIVVQTLYYLVWVPPPNKTASTIELDLKKKTELIKLDLRHHKIWFFFHLLSQECQEVDVVLPLVSHCRIQLHNRIWKLTSIVTRALFACNKSHAFHLRTNFFSRIWYQKLLINKQKFELRKKKRNWKERWIRMRLTHTTRDIWTTAGVLGWFCWNAVWNRCWSCDLTRWRATSCLTL